MFIPAVMRLYPCRQQTCQHGSSKSLACFDKHKNPFFPPSVLALPVLKMLLKIFLKVCLYLPWTHSCTFKVKRMNFVPKVERCGSKCHPHLLLGVLIFVIFRSEDAQMNLVWCNRLFSSEWKQDQDTLQRIWLPDLPARTFLWENSQHVGCKDHFYTAHSPDTPLILEIFIWKHGL